MLISSASGLALSAVARQTRYTVLQDGRNWFGFVHNEADEHEYFPHIGTLVLENDVSHLHYVKIDRGILGKTQIRRGTKILLSDAGPSFASLFVTPTIFEIRRYQIVGADSRACPI